MVFLSLFIMQTVSSNAKRSTFSYQGFLVLFFFLLYFTIIAFSCEQLCGHHMEILLIIIEFHLLTFHYISFSKLASCKKSFCVLLTHMLAPGAQVTAKTKPYHQQRAEDSFAFGWLRNLSLLSQIANMQGARITSSWSGAELGENSSCTGEEEKRLPFSAIH